MSLWWAQLPGGVSPRPSLPGDADVDVAVVGGGFTGLWTAHSLVTADSSLRVAVVEAEVAGFGASGRNGGWCSALFPVSESRLAREHGEVAARSMRLAMQGGIDEIGRVAEAEGIDCSFAKGGTVVAARNVAQVARAKRDVDRARALGVGVDDLRWMDAPEARRMLDVSGSLGATYTPHCAAIDPARLVRGLADAVERRGVHIFERTRAVEIRPGAPGRRPAVVTAGGTVRAEVVVRSVEAWTTELVGERRTLAPVHSLMVATEPLGESFWAAAGLARRQTFADHRHLVVYGQRTSDGRIAFGGRGAPYHYASALRPRHDRAQRVHAALRAVLVELFPSLAGVAFTHHWGGPLALPRDWHPSVGFDASTGLAWAGGYVGDGVTTSNLAGRTLADLVLRRPSDLVRLPWVGHRSPRWEPEPFRWLGINAGLASMRLADRSERRRGKPSAAAARLARVLGG